MKLVHSFYFTTTSLQIDCHKKFDFTKQDIIPHFYYWAILFQT